MFQFRLEAVRVIRMNKEEQALMKLGREQTLLQHHKSRLGVFQAERITMMTALGEKEKEPVSGGFIKLYMNSIRGKEQEIAILKNTIAKQEKVVQQTRFDLGERVKERKIIDVLYDRDYAAFLEKEHRREQDEGDEMAVLRYGGGYEKKSIESQ